MLQATRAAGGAHGCPGRPHHIHLVRTGGLARMCPLLRLFARTSCVSQTLRADVHSCPQWRARLDGRQGGAAPGGGHQQAPGGSAPRRPESDDHARCRVRVAWRACGSVLRLGCHVGSVGCCGCTACGRPDCLDIDLLLPALLPCCAATTQRLTSHVSWFWRGWGGASRCQGARPAAAYTNTHARKPCSHTHVPPCPPPAHALPLQVACCCSWRMPAALTCPPRRARRCWQRRGVSPPTLPCSQTARRRWSGRWGATRWRPQHTRPQSCSLHQRLAGLHPCCCRLRSPHPC